MTQAHTRCSAVPSQTFHYFWNERSVKIKQITVCVCVFLSVLQSEILFTAAEIRYFSLLQNLKNSSRTHSVKLTIHLHLRTRSRMKSSYMSGSACHTSAWCAKWQIYLHLLTFIQPMFTYANAGKKKTPIQIHFICLGKNKIYCNFGMWSTISVSVFIKWCLFHNFIFFCSNNTNVFHKSCALKFKYKPSSLRL